MIKARIRWCTCRVENILTLGILLSLWFYFLLHSILFLISQTSYRTYKIISSYELARPIMGTIFLVYWVSEANPTLGCSIEISRDIYIFVPRHVICNLRDWSKSVGYGSVTHTF